MPPTPRTRRSKNSQGPVAELKGTVDALIKENRTLKRQLARIEQKSGPSARGRQANPVATGLARLVRKVERALASAMPGPGPRGRRSATKPAVRTRKPASPETQQKRIAALAKARAVRAANKAAAPPS